MLSPLGRAFRTAIVAGLLVSPSVAGAEVPSDAKESQRAFEQYVRVDELPTTEKLPAAPFVVGAYSVVWLLALAYIGTIWRRLNRLEDEFTALERRKNVAR